MEVYQFRQAVAEDANQLTALALLSKAHWGYSEEWLTAWRDELTVTPDIILHSISIVAETAGQIVGFWCRSAVQSDEPTRGMLFIHPDHMGKGLGRQLWNAVKEEAQKRGVKHFTIEADPNAVAFYLKMGAIKIGEIESSVIPGRKIPILKFTFESSK